MNVGLRLLQWRLGELRGGEGDKKREEKKNAKEGKNWEGKGKEERVSKIVPSTVQFNDLLLFLSWVQSGLSSFCVDQNCSLV